MASSNFLNGYIFLFIHDVRYAHILYMLHKKCYVLHIKLFCVNKKRNISHRSYVAQQNYVSQKYILWQQKELSDTQKRDQICLVLHRKGIHVDKK